LRPYRKAKDIVICVISKSGNTTETITNATVLLAELAEKFGHFIYEQVVWISDQRSPLYKYGKKMGGHCVAVPEAVGGRYSVGTAVGLVPLALAGVDTEEYMAGFLDASSATLESVAAESAARLALYHELKYVHYNFFAFESRLEKLAAWYRQLMAESLGKSERLDGTAMPYALVPSLSTPTELHSVGQLYFSRITSVYTDFVSFDDATLDVFLPKKDKLAGKLAKYSMQEIATAIYGGVIAAYQERQLPYRSTILDDNLPYALGVFMAMRIREVIYTAHLLKVNAFDQPNVELYKQKTKEILGL
jgi:glucose-6-phosphate isomerase